MSDSSITTIVSGVVTVTTMVVGFLTLWVRLKYGERKADSIEAKVEHNTQITSQATEKVGTHVADCDERISRIEAEYGARISSLETGMASLKVLVESVDKSVGSTRHELRGHLQTLTNKLDLLTLTGKTDKQ